MSGYTHTGRVYFVACGAYVKIGYTSTPIAQRLKSLRTEPCAKLVDFDATEPWRVIRLIPGCIMRDERRIHGLFAAHHVIGEWYSLTPAFLRQLQLLEYVTDREVLANFRAARREIKRAHVRQAAA